LSHASEAVSWAASKDARKVQTAIRFDPDVLAALRATGRGWQTKVNDVMHDWMATHGH